MENYDFFNIPVSCKVKNTIFKKLFYENAGLSASDKVIFIDIIKKITWIYCLKNTNINIQPYKDDIREYAEVEFIEVELGEDKKINKIAEIIMKTIPYPIVLMFKLKQKVKFCVSHQRNNLNDRNRNTIEELITTDWVENESLLFDKLDIRKMRLNNFYNLYSDIVDVISIYNAKDIINLGNNTSGEDARQLMSGIQDLERELAYLKSMLKNETQFNKKIELNIQINKLNKRKLRLTGGILNA